MEKIQSIKMPKWYNIPFIIINALISIIILLTTTNQDILFKIEAVIFVLAALNFGILFYFLAKKQIKNALVFPLTYIIIGMITAYLIESNWGLFTLIVYGGYSLFAIAYGVYDLFKI